jgi:hypothetical protein
MEVGNSRRDAFRRFYFSIVTPESQGSSVSIETRLRAERSGFDSLQGLGILCRRVQTGSGDHRASYLVGTGDFPRG